MVGIDPQQPRKWLKISDSELNGGYTGQAKLHTVAIIGIKFQYEQCL